MLSLEQMKEKTLSASFILDNRLSQKEKVKMKVVFGGDHKNSRNLHFHTSPDCVVLDSPV